MNLFSPCLFGHDPHPIKVMVGKVLHLGCFKCGADLGPVLPGQQYRARKIKKGKKVAAVLKLRKVG